MNDNLRFFTKQLNRIIILFTIVLLALGGLLYMQILLYIDHYAVSQTKRVVSNSARFYSDEIFSEITTLEHIGNILSHQDENGQNSNEKKAIEVIKAVFENDPNMVVGIMHADGTAVYGEKLSGRDYTGIMQSMRGNITITNLNTGGTLFCYPVIHDDIVHYVVYEMCSSSFMKTDHGLSAFGDIGDIMVTTKDGSVVVPINAVDQKKIDFYKSNSVRQTFNSLAGRHNLESVVAEIINTTFGEMIFFSAEINDTEFVMIGAISKEEAVGRLKNLPIFVMGVYFAFVIVVLVLAMFLVSASVKVRESSELREAKQIAEDASKAKGDFIANMSHEIRTPINAVMGVNEIILRDYNDATLRKYAYNIKSAMSLLLNQVNDILDFSRFEADKMVLNNEPYNVSSVVMDLVNMMTPRADKKGLTFNKIINENMPENLIGDSARLRQVIINLLSNAIKYTNEGYINLYMDYEKVDDKNIKLNISVEDTGIGMKAEDIENLFTAFTRFDENRNKTIEGTGLGMAIVKKIMDLMGSKIDVESEYGKGSKFSFSIVQEVEDWEPIGNYEETYEKNFRNEVSYKPEFVAPAARVLFVDDTEMNIFVLKGLLKQTKMKIDSALSGKAALELIDKNEYDVLLIDHRMPEMDGMELLSHIRENKENINHDKICIALTANVVDKSRDIYINAGFDDFMAKPVDGKTLEKMLLKYIPKGKIGADEEGEKSAEVAGGAEKSQQSGTDSVKELELLKELEKKEVLNIDAGIEYAGSEEMFIETVRFFRDAIDTKSDEIEEYYFKEDYENYTVKVHALKSSARIIGANNLSEMARLCEEAGKEGNIDYIKDNNFELLSSYRKYKELLKEV